MPQAGLPDQGFILELDLEQNSVRGQPPSM